MEPKCWDEQPDEVGSHTPGPWKSEEYHNTYEIWGNSIGRIAVIAKDTGDYPAAEANARIIASALDMLAALERICRVYQESENTRLDAIIEARAAIKLARGRGE